MTQPIIFVSLGPGDPELITLKGLKALQKADFIFCPTTTNKNGERLSRAFDIVEALDIDIEKIKLYDLPMSKQRDGALSAYREVAKNSTALSQEGYKIVITAEGDGGFYSSSQYINAMLMERGVSFEKIAGVPAFIACGALANIHIVSQEESLDVTPQIRDIEDLTGRMKEGSTLVLMKLSQSEKVIKEVASLNTSHEFHYFEHAGVEGKEYYTSDKGEIIARKFPYFSILIIKMVSKN